MERSQIGGHKLKITDALDTAIVATAHTIGRVVLTVWQWVVYLQFLVLCLLALGVVGVCGILLWNWLAS